MNKKQKLTDDTATVLSCKPLVAGYWEMFLRSPGVASRAMPGQFVHLRLPTLEASALRRPFSICGADGDVLRLLFKTVGRGSEALAHLAAGTSLQVMGPLGNGFPQTKCAFPVCVAGGYGVAPLRFLASRSAAKGVALIGGRTAQDILLAQEFADFGWRVEIATQDGSLGTKGLVTVLLEKELQNSGAEVFACGPTGMLKSVGELASSHGCKAWLSLDKHMVCGVGACLGCIQKLRRDDGTEWLERVCKDGPVFEMSQIIW